jgi:hypothetical protein
MSNNYNKTDQRLHLLSQTITKANRTYIAPKEDDSHTNLYYDELDNRIVGRWISNGSQNMMLTLNLETLQFEWLDYRKEVVQSVATIGRAISDIENDLSESLQAIGLNSKGFTEGLHYQIPDYPFAKEPVLAIDKTDMNHWQSYRNLANELCGLVLGYLGKEEEIRIWPHHFDTGIYAEVDQKVGIGFGLAMEDSMAGAAYFYLSGYPLQGTFEYKNLPSLASGRWEVGEHWQGAILPITNLSSGLFSENREAISEYLLNSIKWFSKHH